MSQTGWMGDAPDGGPALPVTEMLLRNKQRRPGDALAQAMARGRAAEAREARDAAATAFDPDEHAAMLVSRGYQPGLLNELSQRLGDTAAELADERDKLEKAARRQERAAREHAAGRVDVFRMQAMMDGDDGDEDRVRVLERRAESLKRQIAEAQDAIAPPERRQLGGVEAASRHAHQVFREVTRQRMAAAQDGRVVRPFASDSRGDAVRNEPVTCADCIAVGATPDQSYLIHVDPDAPAAVRLPVAELTEAEIDHLVDLGYSRSTAQLAARPYEAVR